MSVEHRMHCGGNEQGSGGLVWRGWWLGLVATEDLAFEGPWKTQCRGHTRLQDVQAAKEGVNHKSLKN